MKKNKSWKKGMALFAAAALTVASLPASPLMAYAAGSQETAAEKEKEAEAAERITISSREEFLKFAKNCRDDFYSYGKVFVLEADIDLSGTSFQGVPYFQGTLEGNGHTVSGFLMTREGSDYGLFRYVGKAGKIKDLNVSGKVELTGSGKNAGGVVGVNYGIVENCSFDGTVSAGEAAGGIVGENKEDGIVMSCSASGSVKATNETGGICGLNRGIIQKCTNSGTINDEDLKTTLDLNGVDLGTLNLTQNVVTRNDLGGIAGRSYGTISECVNEGKIGYPHVGYNAGGIVGRQSGTVLNCVNKGEVLGRKDVGGIAGQAEPYRESEYLSEHLDKVRDDFSTINHLMHQMSDALSSVSSDTKAYVQMLQDQYEDTIGTLDREIKEMRDAVSGNNKAMTSYMDSLTEALKNLGDLGNDTISRLLENLKYNMENAADKLGGKLEGIGNVLKPEKPERPEETETESESEPETETEGEPETGTDGTDETGTETEPSGTQEPSKPEETQNPSQTQEPSGTDGAGGGTEEGQQESVPSDGNPETGSGSGDAENGREPGNSGKEEGASEQPAEPEGAYFARENESLASEAKLPDIDIPGKDEIESQIESGKDELESGLEDKKDQIHDIIHNDPIRYEKDKKIDDNIDDMKDAVDAATDNIKNMQGTLSGTGDSVTDAMSNISGELNEQSKNSGDTIDSMTDTINSGIQSVSSDLEVILNTSSRITDIIADDMEALFGGEGVVEDISSEDIAKRTRGVLSGCENHGKVEGDVNAGGIAGTMNVEYDIDPELDMNFSGLTDVEVRATTNAVLISCKNYGTVTGKKNNCGGMAGSENLGLISDCENYGTVRLENGNCLGGIAGYSDSRIDKSSVLCNLEGSSRIGGIAGEGYDISRCLAMVTVLGDAEEMVGSIAGTIDEEGTLSDNYFVKNAWGGVDQVNYAKKAEGCTYEELMEKENVPEGFRQVTVTFEMDDGILKTMQVPYGGTVTQEDVPEAEAEEDSYLKWDQVFPVTHVTSNLTITAENKRWTKSLAYLAEGGEKADFLVEGDFYDSSALLARAVKAPARNGTDAAYAYQWGLDHVPETRSEYLIHFRIPDGADSAAVMVSRNGQWETAETQEDGSYVTAVIPAGAAFAVYAGYAPKASWHAVAGGTAAAAAAVFCVVYFIRKKKKKGKRS